MRNSHVHRGEQGADPALVRGVRQSQEPRHPGRAVRPHLGRPFPAGPGTTGTADHQRFGAVFVAAFPDAVYTVEELLAEGDRVASRYSVQATHQGGLRGIPPTGKAIVSTDINIHRLAGDRIVEQWSQYDMLALLQQLGAIPVPGQSGS
jgi:hypothetical protein